MSLADYYAKFGMTVDPYTMEIVDFTANGGKPPENGRVRMPDGSIETYRNGVLINVKPPDVTDIPEEVIVPYNPALPEQPDGEVEMPDGSIRFYKDGKVTNVMYSATVPADQRLTIDQINAAAAAGTETPTDPTEPAPQVLFTGTRTMPDGVLRGYKDGKIVSFQYPAGYTGTMHKDFSKKGMADLNKQEGLYYDPNPQTPVAPVTPTGPIAGLKQGDVKMPDNSVRTYKNGLVVSIAYPAGGVDDRRTIQEINEQEGKQNDTYTGPVTTPEPVAPTKELQQGYVKMPDGSKRMYIDGKVVSVAYPEGVTGPTIHEINKAEGTKEAAPRIENPMQAVDDFFKGKTPKEPVAPPPLEPTPTPTPAPEPDVIMGNRLDSLIGRSTPAPAPAPAPASTPTN